MMTADTAKLVAVIRVRPFGFVTGETAGGLRIVTKRDILFP